MRFVPLALAALVAAIPLASLAQPAPAPAASGPSEPGARHSGHHGRWMKDLQSLNLTADQKAKIDAFVTAEKTANQNVTDRATRRENMKNLRLQVMGVLTPDQQAQLTAKMRSERSASPAR